MSLFEKRIRPHVDAELAAAEAARLTGNAAASFFHLERAHVLGQASTVQHVRAHVRMLGWAIWQRDAREFRGQLLRIVGAATKTFIGWIPDGNTGGADVSPIKPLPVPPDLEKVIAEARGEVVH
ncbi:DUF3703 domain-containing protein [Sphaerotilaceae bacterium SBD11-9]